MDDKISIKEFKMWLSGVEEMQPEGWHPDARQWQKIREKLETVKEVEQPTQSYAVTPTRPQEVVNTQYVNRPIAPSGPSEIQRVAPAPTAPSHGLFADSPSVPVRTPNIDTSVGPYESSFT